MTYFQFLFVFLGIPIAVLAVIVARDRRNGRNLPSYLKNLPFALVLLIHVLVAVIYTTPWDNYLVATGVWHYDPGLVTGFKIGWVPVEEYTFFVVQTILFGLFYLFLARRLPEPHISKQANLIIRMVSAAGMLCLGLFGLILFLYRLPAWTYLGLILLWAAPPVALQCAFGADLLWRYRKLAGIPIILLTIYLGAADSLAIGSGTWTISPGQSLQVFLPGGLPLEELVFFLATNCLIGFGMTLALARESRERFANMRIAITRKRLKDKDKILLKGGVK